MWLSTPTWPNHPAIMRAVGLETRSYPYFDPATNEVEAAGMLDALTQAGSGDVVLLHGCCHNPTGAELTPEHWDAIADLAAARGFLPFVDFAYQGFGDGLEQDALGVRRLAARVPEMVVAASCSKNFGLYRDRVGCAFVLGASPERADVMLGQLLGVARASYSSPPAHGAAIVGAILDDAALRAEWRAELDDMRAHMQGLRRMLAASLRARCNGDRFDFLARHRGMFSLIGATGEQVARLRDEHAVYMVGAGRINIAGLPEAEVDRFADALIRSSAGRGGLADLGQAPDLGRGELEAVAGRVAEIEGAAATRPADLLLDRHTGFRQARLPAGERALGYRKAGVAGAFGAVWRDVAAARRGVRLEQQEHAGAAFEEHEQPGLLAVALEPQNLAVEPLGRLQVVDIEDGLQDPVDRGSCWLHGSLRPPVRDSTTA